MQLSTAPDFRSLSASVLRGEIGLASAPGVRDWPRSGSPSSVFYVFLHPRFPGAVALCGVLGSHAVYAGTYSESLRLGLLEDGEPQFDFAEDVSRRGLEAVSAFLHEVHECFTAPGSDPGPFLLVPGIEGAELLAELEAEALELEASSLESRH